MGTSTFIIQRLLCSEREYSQRKVVTIGEKDGYTPMHGAGFQGRAEIGQLLISHGLNAREKHSDGFETIQRACWGNESRHTQTVKMFLENGVWDENIYKSCKKSPNANTV